MIWCERTSFHQRIQHIIADGISRRNSYSDRKIYKNLCVFLFVNKKEVDRMTAKQKKKWESSKYFLKISVDIFSNEKKKRFRKMSTTKRKHLIKKKAQASFPFSIQSKWRTPCLCSASMPHFAFNPLMWHFTTFLSFSTFIWCICLFCVRSLFLLIP